MLKIALENSSSRGGLGMVCDSKFQNILTTSIINVNKPMLSRERPISIILVFAVDVEK